MNRTRVFLHEAARIAVPRTANDPRNFWLGAVGVRRDGAIVYAVNGSALYTEPTIHCEYRLARKLDGDSTVYLARVRRDSLQWALSRPCPTCRMVLKARGVNRVYYTISHGEFGRLEL